MRRRLQVQQSSTSAAAAATSHSTNAATTNSPAVTALTDEITNLPGWSGDLPSKWYSGYVNISSEDDIGELHEHPTPQPTPPHPDPHF